MLDLPWNMPRSHQHDVLVALGGRAATNVCLCVQVKHPTYHHISGTASLSSQLAQKTIIEYPELTVVLPDEADMYGLQETAAAPQMSPVSGIPFVSVQDQPAVTQEPMAITA